MVLRSSLSKTLHFLGPHQAAIEIKWMRQAAPDPHALQLMVQRRAQGEPLQYILGTQPFGPLNILTRAPTLIPRPETEQWTTELATKIRERPAPGPQRPLRALDLCTGSGCIPLLLSHLLHIDRSRSPIQMTAMATDISPSACQLAHDNIGSCGLPPGFSLEVRQKNIFDDDFWDFFKKAFRVPTGHTLAGEEDVLRLDIVTANPPYIPRNQWRRLPSEVKDWEDPIALLGDPHPENTTDSPVSKGLIFYERIKYLLLCPGILTEQSIVAMEIGDGQAEDVVKIFDNGFGRVEVRKDLWGKERAVFIYGHAWS